VAPIRPGLDLGGSLRWNLIATRSLSWAASGDGFTPIPDQAISCNSPVIQIGARVDSAPLHWFLGCWVTPLLLISPDSYTQFITGTALDSIAVPLNRLKLIDIGLDEPMPYLLQIKIQQWHRQIDIEIYGYDFSV
jgi:hypothetical protein